jgi:hypothetical protein
MNTITYEKGLILFKKETWENSQLGKINLQH